MNKERVNEILESQGVIDVTFNNNPVWLEGIGTNADDVIQVRDIETNKLMTVDIRDLEG